MRKFSYDTAVRGQEISKDHYYQQLNMFPPISIRGRQGSRGGFQVSDPRSHVEDLRTGRWRGLYATFTCSSGHYYFQGYNFAGEVDSRPYIREPEERS